MTDDPRDILRAAGAECRELTLYMHLLEDEAAGDDSEEDEGPYAVDVYVALARLAAKYKWQRDEGAKDLATCDTDVYVYHDEERDRIVADLDRRWKEHHA